MFVNIIAFFRLNDAITPIIKVYKFIDGHLNLVIFNLNKMLGLY